MPDQDDFCPGKRLRKGERAGATRGRLEPTAVQQPEQFKLSRLRKAKACISLQCNGREIRFSTQFGSPAAPRTSTVMAARWG